MNSTIFGIALPPVSIEGTGALLQEIRKNEAVADVIEARGQHTLELDVYSAGFRSE